MMWLAFMILISIEQTIIVARDQKGPYLTEAECENRLVEMKQQLVDLRQEFPELPKLTVKRA